MAVSDGMGLVPDGTSAQKREKHRRYGAGRAGACAGRRASFAGRHGCGAGRHNPPVAYDVKMHFRVERHGCCAGRHV